MKKYLFLFLIICIVLSCGKKQDTSKTKQTAEKTAGWSTKVPNQPPTLSPKEEVEWVYGSVEKESGDLYIYVEKRDEYYKIYPEKADTSFNMWELKYCLDIEVDGDIYKEIEIFVDTEAPRFQYLSREVGEMCYMIKKGTKVKMMKQAWEEIVMKKRKFLYPQELAVYQ